VDTAGRLHIDETLMEELKTLNSNINPDEILLVIDSMIGQDAVNVIEGFSNELPITGTILTKMDGDTKGGVALSLRHLTNIPIKFVGTSEKLDGIMEFDPNRMVGRILGEGDIQSLIEHAESVIDETEAKESAKKLSTGKFDLDDFLTQLKQIKKLGPLENMLKLIPGAAKMGLNNVNIDPKQLSHIEAIISSMTKKERKDPDIIKASRKIRIANGSGTSVQEVNKLLNQFENMKKMMKQFKNGNMKLPF
jgi:signal recognition particle subunit SRP54